MEIGRYKILCTNKDCDFTVSRTIAEHTFSIGELELLVKLGKTTEFYDFVSNDKKKFTAGLQFNAENKLVWMSVPDVEREEPCPLCQGKVVDRQKVVKCINEECGLVIFKEISKKTLLEKHIKQLLTAKKTEMITGFFSIKKSAKFDSALIIDEKEKKLVFAPFDNTGTETEHSCLKDDCDGKYFEKRKVFECSKKCGSVIFKNIQHVDVPPSKLTKLLKGEEISITGKRKVFEEGKEKMVSQAMNLHIAKDTGKVRSQFVNPVKK